MASAGAQNLRGERTGLEGLAAAAKEEDLADAHGATVHESAGTGHGDRPPVHPAPDSPFSAGPGAVTLTSSPLRIPDGDQMSDVAAFYDDLAGTYDRIFADWQSAVHAQGRILDALLRGALGDRDHVVLDCAAGIGTQLLGLARRGHRIVGTDLSPHAVDRARAEVTAAGLPAALAVGDMRRLPFASAAFDGVVCADNSVAHLLDDGDLSRALREMCRVLRPGGLLVLTLRDYDRLSLERPRVLPTHLSRSGERLTVTVPLCEWADDGRHYLLRQLQLTERPDGGWSAAERRVTCRAYGRAELRQEAERAGLVDARWIMPGEGSFYQPVLLATRP
jgi:glycine/sarcosine N-methyltransferase